MGTGFRRKARSVPPTPVADFGVPGSDPVMCCIGVKSLASKEALQASRQQLRVRLSMSIFHYDMEL
jgi:hypothetical protein